MAPPLASLRSRVFAATAVVAVLPTALALGFATRRVTQQAEAELSRGLAGGGAARRAVPPDAPRAGRRARLARGRPAEAQGGGRRGRPAHRRARRARLPRARALGRARAGRPPGAARSSPSGPTSRPGAEPRRPSARRAGGSSRRSDAPILLDLGGEAPEAPRAPDARLRPRRRLRRAPARAHRRHVAVAKDGRVFASTLPREPRRRPAGGRRRRDDAARPRRGALRRPRVPLGSGAGSPFVVVLRSRAEALRPLHTLRTALFVAALAAVGLGLLLSWALARTVTRPLAALTDAMKEIAATGDLARRIGPGRPWDDEDARLVARTFDALTGLDRALPAGGRAARAALRARAAVHGRSPTRCATR